MSQSDTIGNVCGMSDGGIIVCGLPPGHDGPHFSAQFGGAFYFGTPGIAATIAMNGGDPLGDEAQNALEVLLEAMKPLSDYQRQTVYEVLGDFYCRRCGREQPPGDCQCVNP